MNNSTAEQAIRKVARPPRMQPYLVVSEREQWIGVFAAKNAKELSGLMETHFEVNEVRYQSMPSSTGAFMTFTFNAAGRICIHHGALNAYASDNKEHSSLTEQGLTTSGWKRFYVSKQGFKICRRCEIEKTLAEFHLDQRREDGRGSYCKSCHHKNEAVKGGAQ
ncbi:hypothetical protein [Aeromonas veronii]|uniref:hypothetical protein n=1 Tax=Aeromonas veronii TaxID=654 RepID=UPI003F7452BF